mmetsp:Transcript_35408/g.53242  ORF Transcript_35408/g.53242 Transcript_35408/m.53242 type:complete len:182 (-) Transcript_35408:185-730(-)|eukprot:CAMPEP_0194756740 /NCGR_PEP_ID=MMETSP0323_2-20130528/10377_1 /TAXON_ID=2866 ORGANISM="Crypthecodinium cohnii, Strain Seligo" /NCGR_SAMPLE_ID=MMETSP0323_2 /ASSEMBLY_ACC=CAM_ASM_000346 /LENGTH=181 /DNA_ID=CAMNT_0039676381 /DNA_START=71 /DNA_END=616 /DNA_ORIENTATION=+
MDADDDTSMSAFEMARKVTEYEAYIEEVLKRDLKASLDEFRKEQEVMEQILELRRSIDLFLREKVTEFESMVDVGCQMYVKAFVPDTEKLFLDVGMGFHLEMTLMEAREFLEHKEAFVNSQLEARKKETAKIKATIHEALMRLDMLMQLKPGQTPWLSECDPALVQSFSAERAQSLVDPMG